MAEGGGRQGDGGFASALSFSLHAQRVGLRWQEGQAHRHGSPAHRLRPRQLAASKEHWARLIDAFEPRHPKLADLMHRAEEDVLAYKTFPPQHWPKILSTNPLEHLNKEIKRRTNVVGTFPNEAAIARLVGAFMLEQNDEWAVTRRYMTL